MINLYTNKVLSLTKYHKKYSYLFILCHNIHLFMGIKIQADKDIWKKKTENIGMIFTIFIKKYFNFYGIIVCRGKQSQCIWAWNYLENNEKNFRKYYVGVSWWSKTIEKRVHYNMICPTPVPIMCIKSLITTTP